MKQSTTKASLLEVILVAEHLLSPLTSHHSLFLLLPRFGRRKLLLLLDFLDLKQLLAYLVNGGEFWGREKLPGAFWTPRNSWRPQKRRKSVLCYHMHQMSPHHPSSQ